MFWYRIPTVPGAPQIDAHLDAALSLPWFRPTLQHILELQMRVDFTCSYLHCYHLNLFDGFLIRFL